MEILLNIMILILEGVGGLFIVGAASLSLYDLIHTWLNKGLNNDVEPLRLQFCQRLVFALEFLIAADILATIHTPTIEHIALLASVILVRTVLSLSISYELRQGFSSVNTKGNNKKD
ncbi:MAG: DUF1622 domain-containing protein [Gammaproteobacteria bacterium]